MSDIIRIRTIKKMLKEALSAKIQAENEGKDINLAIIAKKHKISPNIITAAYELKVFSGKIHIDNAICELVLKHDRVKRKAKREALKLRKKEFLEKLIKENKTLKYQYENLKQDYKNSVNETTNTNKKYNKLASFFAKCNKENITLKDTIVILKDEKHHFSVKLEICEKSKTNYYNLLCQVKDYNDLPLFKKLFTKFPKINII